MSYDVEWLPTAEVELANIWTNAPDKAAVTASADAVDSVLASNPLSVGEGRGGERRILFMEPLVVEYQVRPQDHGVTVFNVWRWPS